MRVAVYKDRYPTSFVVPRISGHDIDKRYFLPFDKLSSKLDGIALLDPFHNSDLVHAFNRIPVGARKYVISFESHLPRRFSVGEDNAYTNWMTRQIAKRSCRRIIALSHYAKRDFLSQISDFAGAEDLKAKLLVRHPNIHLGGAEDQLAEKLAQGQMDELVVTFVGGHFARKGGCVAAVLAQKAHERNLPLRIQIVSSLTAGDAVWTDPTSGNFFDPYFDMLKLPNVTLAGSLPNDEVRQMFATSHFGFLPTFADTFGYSIIEAMAEHTPSIATAVQAIPEFVADGINGHLIPLDTDDLGNWIKPAWDQRGTDEYAAFFADEVEKLAEHSLKALLPYLDNPAAMLPLRRKARHTAEQMFSPEVSAAFYDDFYARIAAESTRTKPVLDPVRDVSSPTVDDLDFSDLK